MFYYLKIYQLKTFKNTTTLSSRTCWRATKNLNLLYIKQSIMCQFEKPPTFTGERENKNLKNYMKKTN